jgi:hypothetical protein
VLFRFEKKLRDFIGGWHAAFPKKRNAVPRDCHLWLGGLICSANSLFKSITGTILQRRADRVV